MQRWNRVCGLGLVLVAVPLLVAGCSRCGHDANWHAGCGASAAPSSHDGPSGVPSRKDAEAPASQGSSSSAVAAAKQYLVQFEAGKPYASRLSWPLRAAVPVELTVGNRADPAAVKVLEGELSQASAEVRSSIVTLLVDLGISTDPSAPLACEAIRDPNIIGALARGGLAQDDHAREEASIALRKYCTQSDLAQFGTPIARALEQAPAYDAFLLVAKAKPPEARKVVTRLLHTEEWKEEGAKIAAAALGDQKLEGEFLRQASAATNGKALAEALKNLSLVGTKRCLEAVAGYLRTPMTIEVPHAFKKSVRLDVLDALVYHFPYEPVLNSNLINDDSGYAAAERFCTQTLGVQYTEPRPPFLTYQGYPSR